MINAQLVPLSIDRGSPRVFTIQLIGIDLTAADLHAQLRLTPDAPGDPLLDLPKVNDATATGVRLVAVDTTSDALPSSYVRVQIPAMQTGTGAGQLPAAAEVGDDVSIYWDMFIKPAGRTVDRWFYGPVPIVATVTKMSSLALVDDPLPGVDAVATLQGPDLTVSISGAALIAPLLDSADGSAGQAVAARDAALQYRNDAQAARDATIAQAGGTFESTAPASLLVLDAGGRMIGQVPDPDIPVLRASVMALTGVATSSGIYETTDTTPQVLLLDAGGRIITRLPDPTVTALLASASTSSFYETTDTSTSLMVLDAGGRIVASVPNAQAATSEVIAARGDRVSLGARINQGLTPYGTPIGPVYAGWNIQETRMRLRKRKLNESTQLIYAALGHSYVQNYLRFVGPLAQNLQNDFGSAGLGWIGFGWFNAPLTGTWTSGSQPGGQDLTARADLVTITQIIGTWTCLYNSASTNAPSLSKITSSTAGDYVRWNFTAGHTAANLFYSGDGTGVVQVSWDDGATYSANITLPTVGAGTVALTGVPSGAAIARIKVISGNVGICGVDMQSAADGVRVHKLGGSGSSASQWAGVTRSQWAAMLLALNPKLISIMLAANDQGGSVSPGTWANYISIIIANIRSVLPYSDILIMMEPENQRTTNVYPMAAYSQAGLELAAADGSLGFLDTQFFFGSAANFAFAYAYANIARQWFSFDLLHPDPPTGGRVIADAGYRLLTSE